MPAVAGAAIGAAVATGTAAAVGAIAVSTTALLSTFALSFAGNLVLGAVSKALQKKPKIPSLDRQDRIINIREPVSPWRIVVGETRVGGTIVFLHSTDDNSKLHMVIVLAAHEVEAIGDIYFNEELVPLDSSGNATGRYADHVIIKKHLGTDDQTADATLMAAAPDKWTSNHRLRGKAYIYVQLTYSQDLFPSSLPTISAIVKGAKWLDPRDDTTKWTNNPALIIRGYLTNSSFGLGADATEIDDDLVEAEANTCEEFVDLTDKAATFTADASSDLLTLGSGLEDMVTGERFEVSTAGTLPTGLSADTSYYWIRKSGTSGYAATSYANALAGTKVDITAAGSGAHTLTRNGQPRYTCNGVFELDEIPKDILQSLLTSCAGRLVFAGGKWRPYVGAYRTPSITLDETDARAPLKVQSRVSRREIFNRVKGVYISPVNFYQPSDFPPVTNATYLAEDNNEPVWKDIDLPFTDSPVMAQRLAKIELERARQQITVAYPCNLKAYRLTVPDSVQVDNTRFGWSDKVFEITDWQFAIEDDDGAPRPGIDLALRETASTVYDWDSGEETTIDPAPDTDLPNPFTVGAPSGLTLESGTDALLALGEGSVISRIRATWTPPTDAFVQRQEIQFKKSAGSTWTGETIAGDATEHFVGPTEDGVAYDVRVRAINSLGVRGMFTTALNHVVVGKTAAPPVVDSFTVARLADGTRRFAWNLATVPADVRAGGGYRIRYSLSSTSDWDTMTALHDGILTSSPYETNALAAGTYWFAIKTVDSSGNESATAKFINNVSLGDPRLRNVLIDRLESALGWPGTLTSCYEYNGTLRATGAAGISDLPATISGLASSIVGMVDRASPIAYETPEIDLGTDVSFTPLVTVVANGTVTITMKTGSDADGGVTGSYVTLATAVAKRYVQIKVSVAGTAPRIDEMTTLLDGETIVETFEDVDTSSETGTWFESVAAGHFKIGSKSGDMASVTGAVIRAIQNVGAGWSWTLVSKSQTVNSEPAAEFKVWNESGTLADATVDVEIKGPKNT